MNHQQRQQVLQEVRRQYEAEQFESAVKAELNVLREIDRRSLIRRLLDLLPFTITITWKKT